jgi:pimeloyl-ACP methyl ester carboxylesterase
MKTRRALWTIALAAFVLAGCSNPMNTAIGESAARCATPPPPGAEIRIPDTDWTGDVVLIARGYAFPDELIPSSLGGINPHDPRPDLADLLNDEGIPAAWADYGTEGYAVEEGYNNTKDLWDWLEARYGEDGEGKLRDLYVIGTSMGSLIALKLAEHDDEHPCAGALVVDGIAGGATIQRRYLGNVRALFGYFFPFVIPYGVLEFPNIYELNDMQLALLKLTILPRIEAWVGYVSSFPLRAQVMAGMQARPDLPAPLIRVDPD